METLLTGIGEIAITVFVALGFVANAGLLAIGYALLTALIVVQLERSILLARGITWSLFGGACAIMFLYFPVLWRAAGFFFLPYFFYSEAIGNGSPLQHIFLSNVSFQASFLSVFIFITFFAATRQKACSFMRKLLETTPAYERWPSKSGR